MSIKTDTPCVLLPAANHLSVENVISNTASHKLEDREKCKVGITSSVAKFFHADGILDVFARGFLAEPVLRDAEESYRYLMALDRY
ncbi:unnamed protein product [Thelazia callipaeda]|uniref:Transcriptional regulator n=1 Tax=Thelazia callipaeda TaxID=103827 RepID=A0A0N5CZZ9_THECL|nr:unnamed protein product [Thelazia callipaeda]